MEKLAYITHPKCLEHDTGFGHPERSDRLRAIHTHLEAEDLKGAFAWLQAEPAAARHLTSIHTDVHLDTVSRLIKAGAPALDAGDTAVSRASLDAAFLAAGSAVQGIDLIREGRFQRVFCGVRPPGHHAEAHAAMGFCIFNNVAVAAAYARACGLAEKVLIVDWDVHHGNGTQHIFEADENVYYYSIHQYPFYPGTGAATERGRHAGEGYTLNRPLSPGHGDTDYLRYLESDLNRIVNSFEPDLVLISAGFDAHAEDPLGAMQVSDEGFGRMTEMLVSLAVEKCQGRILSILEGGYNLNALARAVARHLNHLMR